MALATSSLRDAQQRIVLNHDILSCTHEGVKGNYLYSGRALGMTLPEDIIQIHPFLRREWRTISDHYTRVGLAHSQHVIWDTSYDRLADYPDLHASVFFFGPAENKTRKNNDWFRVVEHINSKNNFTALASHLRLDVPHTQCFHGKQWFAGIQHFPYPCYVKAAVSVAGKGIFRCETPEDVIKALAHFDEDVPLQVQEEIKTNVFLNVQYLALGGHLQRLMVTEQVLDGFTHQGNRYPASHEPWESVEPMAQWLLKKGIQDVFAFDVGVVHENGETRFIPIECNPRFNGASYPTAIAAKLQLSSWVAKEFSTQYRCLADIDLSGIEYDSSRGSGVVLVNWGTVLVGKLAILIAGSEAEQQRLELELLKRL